jgi:HEPN domain-containing protein
MANEKERWLAEAQEDRVTAEVLFREGRYSASAFHSQQSAEKALKSVLYGLHDVPWGHSVMNLLEQVKQLRPLEELEDLASCARILDRHYIGARNPNAYPSGTAPAHYDDSTAREALECARKFLQMSNTL